MEAASGRVRWTAAGGTPHTDDTADAFLPLHEEWPALPHGPDLHLGSGLDAAQQVHRTTEAEVLDYRLQFLEAIDYVAQWISVYAEKARTAMQTGEEKRAFRSVGRDALAYYERQYVEMTIAHSAFFTDLWEYGFGKTSLRICLFFELCRLRVILREAYGPRWPDDCHPQDWPYLATQKIALPKKKPIGLFTLQELEQAFVYLFRYWNSMPYHPELEQFVNRLLDKQATFFCATAKVSEMNVALYRNPLRDGSNENAPNSSEWVGPTQTFLFKAQLRYFNLVSRFLLVKGRTRVPFRTLKLPEQLPYPYHVMHPSWIESLLQQKATVIRAEMHERTREVMMQDLLHPGDREWLSYLRPVASVTNQMMIDLFHEEESARYDREAKIKTGEALLLRHHSLRTGSKSRIVLDLVDKMFPYDLKFMEDYVIAWPDMFSKWDKLLHHKHPMLVQFFGHFELYWLGRIYTLHPSPAPIGDQPHPNTVSGMYARQTIYDTVFMWLQIMAYNQNFEATWHVSLRLQVEEWIQAYLFQSARANNKTDEEAAEDARSTVRAYKERQQLALAHMESVLHDPAMLEVERLFSGATLDAHSSDGPDDADGSDAMEVGADDAADTLSAELPDSRGNPLQDPMLARFRPMVETRDVTGIEMPLLTFY